jgi:hypothetical protein
VVSGSTAPAPPLARTAIEPRERGGPNGRRGGGQRGDSGGGTGAPEDEGPPPSSGGVAGVSGTHHPGAGGDVALILPLSLLALALAALAAFLVARRRSEPEPAVVTVPEPKPERPVWTPWRRSTMDGPGWTAEPPPSHEGSWADSPAQPPQPKPEPSQEAWSSPPSGRPARR